MIFEILYIVLPITYGTIICLAMENCPSRIFYWDNVEFVDETQTATTYWRDVATNQDKES